MIEATEHAHVSNPNGFKLEGNNIFGKYPDMMKLNNTLQYKQWVKEEITKEDRKYCEINENEDITYQTSWDAVNSVVTKTFRSVPSTARNKKDCKSIA